MININEYLINKNTKEKQSIYDVILDAVKQCKNRAAFFTDGYLVEELERKLKERNNG